MKRLFTVALLVFSVSAIAQTTHYFNTNGIAIQGYDPVAYFTKNMAVKGTKDFIYNWQGTEWRFSDQANLNAFKLNPEMYAPQFGGFCAYGVSEDHKSPTEPDAFTIVDEKLYLNYNQKVRTMWRKDIPGHVKKAEINWVGLKNKND